MASILETNLGESTSILSEPKVLIIGLTVIAVISLLTIMSKKELKNSRLSIKKSVLILLFYLLIVIPAYYTNRIIRDVAANEVFRINKLLTIQGLSSASIPLVYGDILTIMAYLNEMNKLNSYKETQRELPEGITVNKESVLPKKIYLLLGESSSRDYYSLYGYSQPTTPFLDSLYRAETSYLNFYDAIAPAPITRDALRIALSFASPVDEESFYKYKNIIELANDRGYETIWMSNQELIGIFDTYVGFISSCSHYSFFKNDLSKQRDDLDLIDVLKEKYDTEKKQFFVIHMQGSHMRYTDKIDDIDRKAIKDETTEGNYARTIHHTDRFIRSIYNVSQNDDSSLIYYFSDHGELLGLGHGLITKGSRQFDVPLITISNNITNVDSIVSQYKDPESGMINNTSTTYILSEIMGYDVSEYLKQQSVQDGKYIYHVNSKTYLYKDFEKGTD